MTLNHEESGWRCGLFIKQRQARRRQTTKKARWWADKLEPTPAAPTNSAETTPLSRQIGAARGIFHLTTVCRGGIIKVDLFDSGFGVPRGGAVNFDKPRGNERACCPHLQKSRLLFERFPFDCRFSELPESRLLFERNSSDCLLSAALSAGGETL